MTNDDFVLITGTANLMLAKAVGKNLKKEVLETAKRFADGEIRIKIPKTVRGKRVFILQPTCPPVNNNLMELLFMIDAARRASATEITAVIPYFGYSRQDRKEQPRVPISVALVADLIEHSGASRVVTVDIHSEQQQGFIKIPWDNLYASYSLVPVLKRTFTPIKSGLVIASPDKNGVPRATAYARLLNAESVAIVYKERDIKTENVSQALELIGDVKGKEVLLVDDMIDTAGTLVGAVELLQKKGAKSISAAVTHGLFSPPALQRINDSLLKEVYVTDTINIDGQKLAGKIKVVSVAKLLAEAIKCIYTGESISKKLFP
ncbi:MAG: Uncharacterized protein CEO21_37 [Microgenomates group bacterium Gr01-1014_80]|nr:MAG: Uncharacterized protein CEO21_37 [Microgenomates group bacterium Gr01-1014_80]